MSRALNKELAQAGHDYFEVVFKQGTNIARAAWELGNAALIKDVPHGFYDDTGDNTGDPDASKAILFVGRKSDKTLLAIGLLTAVDGGGFTIGPTSKTATFTVAALQAGTTFVEGTSSFLTGSATVPGTASVANTNIEDAENPPLDKFPMYKIPPGETAVAASYSIACVSPADIDDYVAGIRVAKAPSPIQVKIPRYGKGGGLSFELKPPYATSTVITYTTNDAAGAFSKTTEFDIDTDGTNNEGVIAFTFSIPVYAIDGGASTTGVNPITWQVSPSFGSSRFDLDDGTGSLGGSILLGIGSVSLGWIEIITSGP
jgi:hypothetical protein